MPVVTAAVPPFRKLRRVVMTISSLCFVFWLGLPPPGHIDFGLETTMIGGRQA
jgi:hypothetical protein